MRLEATEVGCTLFWSEVLARCVINELGHVGLLKGGNEKMGIEAEDKQVLLIINGWKNKYMLQQICKLIFNSF